MAKEKTLGYGWTEEAVITRATERGIRALLVVDVLEEGGKDSGDVVWSL